MVCMYWAKFLFSNTDMESVIAPLYTNILAQPREELWRAQRVISPCAGANEAGINLRRRTGWNVAIGIQHTSAGVSTAAPMAAGGAGPVPRPLRDSDSSAFAGFGKLLELRRRPNQGLGPAARSSASHGVTGPAAELPIIAAGRRAPASSLRALAARHGSVNSHAMGTVLFAGHTACKSLSVGKAAPMRGGELSHSKHRKRRLPSLCCCPSKPQPANARFHGLSRSAVIALLNITCTIWS